MSKILCFILLLLKIYALKSPLKKENELNEEDIIILFTNDIHCGITDNIGYDGFMLYKREIQEKYKNVITVDVGDHIAGDSFGVISKGLDVMKIMNKIGYNVSVIGNHEFDYGVDALKECNANLDCGYTTANFIYKQNQTTVFEPYKILEVGNKTIGFIGVTAPLSINDVDEKGELIYDLMKEEEGKILYKNIQGYIDKLRGDGVDYIIILDHIGDEENSGETFRSSNLISNLSGVDAMLDGHTHQVYNYKKMDKEGKYVPIVQTGMKLSNIGLLKIIKDNITIELISDVPEPVEKDGAEKVIRNNKERWIDKEMKELINNIIESHSDVYNEYIGHTDFDLMTNTDPIKDHHKHLCRGEECTIGNLVMDSIRYVGKSEIAISNGALIRGDLLKGNITYINILTVLPYSSNIIVKKVIGQDILDALELSMRHVPEKSYCFFQVSGISFHVNSSIEYSVETDENGNFIRVKGKRRVSNVKVGKEKLDLNKLYTVSFDEYIGNGGDGLSMFGKYDILEDVHIVDNQALIKYIKDELKGAIPDYYRKTQGRIIIDSDSKNDDNSEKDNTMIIIIIISCIIIVILATAIILFFIKKKKTKDINENTSNDIKENIISEEDNY